MQVKQPFHMSRMYKQGYNEGHNGSQFTVPKDASVKDAQEYEAGYNKGASDREQQ